MRYVKILVLAMGLFLSYFATIGHCADIHANSPSLGDVQTAIGTAKDGDTVVVPPGNASWESAISLGDKVLTIQAAGIDVTVVSAPQAFVINGVEGKFVRINGFTFKGGTPGECMIGVYGTSKAWRIDHCKFDNLTASGIGVDGYTYGVVDHCQFLGANLFSGVYVLDSLHINGGVEAWNRPLTLGSDKAVYVEDCDFRFASFGPGIASIDSGSGGRYVFRHNTVQNQSMGHHDAETTSQRGTFSWEVYENNFTYTEPGWTAVYMRGGTGVIFNNKFSGLFTMGTPLYMTNSRSVGSAHGIPWLPPCDGTPDYMWSDITDNCTTPGEIKSNGAKCIQMDGQLDPTGYPCIDQLGRSFDADGDGLEDSAPAYEWNNTEPETSQIWDWNVLPSTHLLQDRDYFKNTPRPGYTPYAHPHRLISEESIVGKPPIAPRNLRVRVAAGSEVTLQWDPNAESDLAGYRLYYGIASQVYAPYTAVGKVTEATIQGLAQGSTYFFALTATDTENLESGYSNEVNHSTCTYTISPSTAYFSAEGGQGGVQVTTQPGCPWVTSNSASWVTIRDGQSGEGSGTVDYSLSANERSTIRNAVLTIAGKVFNAVQRGAPATLMISAMSSSGGKITPSGNVPVTKGANQTFIITPDAGYGVASVQVDGVQVGAVNTYTFTNITKSHTIMAAFSRTK